MSETRKTVTVVFSDVSGSTALGERLDPEALRRVMARYFEETRAVLERHGGTVEKFIGDAVMAVFGIPSVHEDDALRAVRATAELRERLARLNEELERERGVRLEIRTGINTGEVVAGDPAEGQAFATGDTVNVAARLEQAAEPGEVLLGEQTYRLVREAVRTEPVEPLGVKGKTAAVPAWRLVEVVAVSTGFARRVETPLVGRRSELARLRAAFERSATARLPALVTVVGDAGVGKSRLVGELVTSVENEATAVVGRCLSYGEGITYWPLVPMLEQLEQQAPLREILAGVEDTELVAKRIEAAVGRGDAPGTTEETFWAVRKLVGELARDRPLLMVIDDVHWAEPTFLDLVEHVVDWVQDVPLLVLSLARPDFLELRPGWPGERIALERLSDEDADALMQNLVSEELEQETRRRILESAEGNPLFVEQMLAMLAENGHAEPLAVPPTIQALLAARIDGLPSDERAMVERAAVVGKEFWLGAVVALSPSGAEVSVPLQRLVRKGFIRPGRSTFPGEDAFRFRHVLIRDAAYAASSKALRAELHEGFADWLEARAIEYDEIVGYHLEQAAQYRGELGPLDRRGEALGRRGGETLFRAGRRAFVRGDTPAAVNLLRRAYTLLPTGTARLALVPDLFDAYLDSGEFGAAEELVDDAEQAADALGDERHGALARLLRAELRLQTDPHGSTDAAMREAERAIPLFQAAQDDRGLGRAWDVLTIVAAWRGELDRSRTCAERALHYAEKTGDIRAQGESRMWIAAAGFFGRLHVDEVVVAAEAELEWARRTGSRWGEGMAFVALGALEGMRGSAAEGLTLVAKGTAILEELGMRLIRASLTINWVPFLVDDPAEAERELRAAYRVLQDAGDKAFFSSVAAELADAVYARGRWNEAASLASEARDAGASDDVVTQVKADGVRAKVLAREGRLIDAEMVAREALDRARASEFAHVYTDALSDLAEVLSIAGRRPEATEVADEAIRTFEAQGKERLAARMRAAFEELQASPSEYSSESIRPMAPTPRQ